MNSTTHNGKEYMMEEDSNGVITLTPKKEAETRVCNLWQDKKTGELSYGVTSNTIEQAQLDWPLGVEYSAFLIAHVRYNANGKLPKLRHKDEQF